MPNFPTATTWPITAYEYDVDDAQGKPSRITPTPEDWRSAYAASGVLPTVPDENTRYHGGEAFGWGGFTDNEPLILEPYLVLMRRSFVKRIPASTLKAAVEQQGQRWIEARRDEGSDVNRVPKGVRVEIRERLVESMLKQAIPTIKNVIVIVDTNARRAYVLARGKHGEHGIATNLRRLIEKAHGGAGVVRVTVNEIDLKHYMVWAHEATPLPADVAREFMHDLAHHARCSHTLRIDDAQFPSVMLELGGRIEMVSGDDRETLRASGVRETERLLSERIEGEDDEELDTLTERADAELTRLQFVAHDELGTWSFVIGRNADIQRAEMPRLGLDVSDGQEGSVWARVAMVARAVTIMQGIVHAFTVGRLADIVKHAPQQPLFESRVTRGACAPATWLTVSERPAVKVREDEAKPEKQAALFESKKMSPKQAELLARAAVEGVDIEDMRFAVGIIERTKRGEKPDLADVARAQGILFKLRPDLAVGVLGVRISDPNVLSENAAVELADAFDRRDAQGVTSILVAALGGEAQAAPAPDDAQSEGGAPPEGDANVGGHLKANEYPRPLDAEETRALLTGAPSATTPEMKKLLDNLEQPEPGEDLTAERTAALRTKAVGMGYDAAVVDAVLNDEAKKGKSSRATTGKRRGKGVVGGWV